MNLRIQENIYKQKTMSGIIDWATRNKSANFKKLEKYYPTAFMLLTIGVGQTGVILVSDDMPKKRRIPLALNNTINCLISLAGGLITAKYSAKLTDTFVKRAENVIVSNEKEQIIKGIRKAVPVLVSGVLYKYIGPVLATPLTDKLNKFLIKKGFVDYSDKKEGLTK